MTDNKFQTVITIEGLRRDSEIIRKERKKKLKILDKKGLTLKWLKTNEYYQGQLDYIKELISYLK